MACPRLLLHVCARVGGSVYREARGGGARVSHGSDGSPASVGPDALPTELERSVPGLGHAAPVPASVTGAERALRWSVQGASLPLGWEPIAEALPQLERIVAEPHGLWVWLRAGYSWHNEAEAVREGLALMLDEAAPHLAEFEAQIGVDRRVEAVRLAATDVIDGDLAPYIASHGGNVHIIDVEWGEAGPVVSVEFAGACKGCELSEVTLHLRIEKALAKRIPALAEVRDATPRTAPRLFQGLFRRPPVFSS
ncbi:NifU family protein [Dermabacter vaginalis]|uniref:NifU family protein n=1 Tax=Dermabacter vaginalis TaxID=1630135 RepID=A0ABX6A4K6_9MICO|nr:NifU family protein [Dermabacter vaginalis]